MQITASLVKELRERTGAGMMECKNALTEAGGDIDGAVETLRKKGAATADKKASRVAAEGVISCAVDESGHNGVLVEINCETDFVAKDPGFTGFADAVARTIIQQSPNTVEELAEMTMDGSAALVEEGRRDLISKIGENLSIRRFRKHSSDAGSAIASYLHGGRIGVMVVITGSTEVGRDVAMHIAASSPMCVCGDDIPLSVLESEKQIYSAQAANSGKPPEIIEKMVTGRVKKFIKENSLLGQAFVKDPDLSVEQYLEKNDASVVEFSRLVVGEGIEKRADDFVAEVMSQAKGA